jgi:hypothetical protein
VPVTLHETNKVKIRRLRRIRPGCDLDCVELADPEG